jgi:hypothetical protein
LKFFVAPRLDVFCWGLLFVVREARRAICDGRGSFLSHSRGLNASHDTLGTFNLPETWVLYKYKYT